MSVALFCDFKGGFRDQLQSMTTQNSEQPEFSDKQLLDALKRVGRTARQASFSSGMPIVVFKGKQLVRVFKDGRQVILSLDPHADVAGSHG